MRGKSRKENSAAGAGFRFGVRRHVASFQSADLSAHSKLWGRPFAMGLVVAVPTAQGGVAGVGKKKLQRRRFNMAVAKCHVGFASHEIAEEIKNWLIKLLSPNLLMLS
jgi:hypothetical protein